MLQSRIANCLLYVPHNQEYLVPPKIVDELTSDEFFQHCYVNANVDDELDELNNLEDDLSYPMGDTINTKAVRRNLQEQKNEQKNLTDWFNYNGIGVYAICGDAGTGKTTFLKYTVYISHRDYWQNHLKHT